MDYRKVKDFLRSYCKDNKKDFLQVEGNNELIVLHKREGYHWTTFFHKTKFIDDRFVKIDLDFENYDFDLLAINKMGAISLRVKNKKGDY